MHQLHQRDICGERYLGRRCRAQDIGGIARQMKRYGLSRAKLRIVHACICVRALGIKFAQGAMVALAVEG